MRRLSASEHGTIVLAAKTERYATQMARGGMFSRLNEGMNKVMVPLMASPRWRGAIEKHMTVVTYTGRRSGTEFSTPVYYRRNGDTVTIRVAQAAQKNWWRNFEGDGGPISLQLRGADRPGHAIANRDHRGRTTVTVTLDPA